MEVAVVRRIERKEVDIYIRPGGNADGCYVVDGHRLVYDPQPIAPGAEVPVALSLPYDVLEALVGEASDYLPPSAATSAHLDDAREVRDRLLTLVEGFASPPRFLPPAAPDEPQL